MIVVHLFVSGIGVPWKKKKASAKKNIYDYKATGRDAGEYCNSSTAVDKQMQQESCVRNIHFHELLALSLSLLLDLRGFELSISLLGDVNLLQI